MILTLNILLILLSLLILIPSLVFFLECMAAIGFKPSETPETPERLPKIAVLIPAHNEEPYIATTVEQLLLQITPQDRLIVIADNCNDHTAAIARQAGATVLERENQQERGKGYALDYGLDFLKADPPDIVVMVDGDCSVEANTVTRIAQLAYQTHRPVQAIYIMEQQTNPTTRDIISALAIRVKNLVRPLGLYQLGLPNLLTGSGMAFSWPVIQKISLAGSKTTDDMQTSVDLALVGHPPLFCPYTKVIGRLMENESAKSQRSRWEHGHLEMILVECPRLLKGALLQGRFDLFTLALEIAVPPLSLLIMLWGFSLIIAILGGVFGASWLSSYILALCGFMIAIAVVSAWAKFARNDISGRDLLKSVFYIFWKIPIYLKFFVSPQSRWLNTERDHQP